MFNNTNREILNIRVTVRNKVIIFDIGTLFIPNNFNELCGAMDKLFDFEFWDRGSIPTHGDSFVLYSILSFFYEIGAICINR